MDVCRRVLACLALLTASAGPLPLIAHKLTCHHTQPKERIDGCRHGCGCPQKNPAAAKSCDWALDIVSADEDECSACFQLSQLPQPTAENVSPILLEMSPELVVGLQSVATIEAIGPHAPRGPPSA